MDTQLPSARWARWPGRAPTHRPCSSSPSRTASTRRCGCPSYFRNSVLTNSMPITVCERRTIHARSASWSVRYPQWGLPGSETRPGVNRLKHSRTTCGRSSMRVLETVGGPADLKKLTGQQLTDLAAEIRDVLVETVSRTGGHLGPNLGMVEITLAMHRVFDSPRDRLVYDTGHQTYVHKLLTGRAPKFDTLRQQGGLSGYPSQAESEHDIVENSHASTSLSYADGLAKAYRLRGE